MTTASPLKLLILEDNPDDAELVEASLRRSGLAREVRRADGRKAFESELARALPDLVLADYTMGGFDALDALKILRVAAPDVPLIVVTGSQSDEVAAGCIKAGAADYVLKGNLGRLPASVRQVLKARAVEMERRRVTQELEERELELLQAQKMVAVGLLAGGIAHDFNNLLTVLLGYLSFLSEDVPPGDPKQADIDAMRATIGKATDLTRQILAYGRESRAEAVPVDLSRLVADFETIARRLVGKDIQVSVQTDAAAGRILASPREVEQVLLNLVVNARDAMPAGGRLTIATGRSVTGSGDSACITVTDTGTGIDPDTMANLFKPFYTTKNARRGSGLGLSMVSAILRKLGGRVEVDSRPGRGTTFRLHLPIAGRASSGLTADGQASPVRTILLIDDDLEIRRLARRDLEKQGWIVIDAGDGTEALAKAQLHPDPIDLLVTDLIMPGMNGWEVAVSLRQMRGGVAVLFMTGYPEKVTEGMTLGEAPVPLLKKPFTSAALVSAVKALLAREWA